MSISQTKGLRAAFGLPVLLYSPIRNHLLSLAPTAAPQRDKSESDLILTWPILAFGLDCDYAKHLDSYIYLHRLDGSMRFGRQPPA
jgi:hypothetical protein